MVKKDRHGKITGKAPLAVSEAALAKYFAKQDPKSEVVVEASGNWMFLYGTIENYTHKRSWRIRSRLEPLPRRESRPPQSTPPR